MNVCKSCADDMVAPQTMRNICQPIPATNSSVCQNKGCQSSSRIAVGTCFAEDCIRPHQFTPLRLCQECFVVLHDNPTAEAYATHGKWLCLGNESGKGHDRGCGNAAQRNVVPVEGSREKENVQNGFDNSKEVKPSAKKSIL
ncbi:hypothetical protein L596_017413 [Steinernema carpocapsae]|uniref:Uncharacterized protein n=1 Tax=Steinernema carpocapsae TaxID=34508 RepID=A0A4U5N1V3_STECR|nr:hypothetical protein L596_017413 [Steinernema carpocapsae]